MKKEIKRLKEKLKELVDIRIKELEQIARDKGWIKQSSMESTEKPIGHYLTKVDYDEWYELIILIGRL